MGDSYRLNDVSVLRTSIVGCIQLLALTGGTTSLKSLRGSPYQNHSPARTFRVIMADPISEGILALF
jgi:hypothetical protein